MPLFYFEIKLGGSEVIDGTESINFEDEASARAYASGIVSTFQSATAEDRPASVTLRDGRGAVIDAVVSDQSAEIVELALFSKSTAKAPSGR